ncbi:MAG TPA: iron-sulfur cluster assembly accessory protein [Planctomycetota bacterium]|nr:iron-sulfur cluster assembly accessory protein [Planctomycetota bacterium]
MGTFHDNKSALHGITVVVDTRGPKVYVGRCDDEDAEKVILVDADSHDDGANGKSKADYVKRAAKFGVWKRFDHIVIPRDEVVSISRLGDVHESTVKAVAAIVPAPARAPDNAPRAAADISTVIASPLSDKPIVSLTANAQVEVKRLIVEQNKPGLGLRLGVKGGGCSGFSYKLEFDQKKEGDIVVPFEQFNVYLDRKSTIYLRGITLDFQKGLAGKGFVFNNPNATNTCGCGESFSV